MFTYTDNIALNKPAWQSSQYNPGDNTFDASNAVDGLKSDLDWKGGQCAISGESQQTAKWRVDLENILSIRYITIYYRTDNNPWGVFEYHYIGEQNAMTVIITIYSDKKTILHVHVFQVSKTNTAEDL